jgi:chromosome segregation ATPase
MALRDLFDSDPRSKDQLRSEVSALKRQLEDKGKQLSDCEKSAGLAFATATSLRNDLEGVTKKMRDGENLLNIEREKVRGFIDRIDVLRSEVVQGQENLKELKERHDSLKRQFRKLDRDRDELDLRAQSVLGQELRASERTKRLKRLHSALKEKSTDLDIAAENIAAREREFEAVAVRVEAESIRTQRDLLDLEARERKLEADARSLKSQSTAIAKENTNLQLRQQAVAASEARSNALMDSVKSASESVKRREEAVKHIENIVALEAKLKKESADHANRQALLAQKDVELVRFRGEARASAHQISTLTSRLHVSISAKDKLQEKCDVQAREIINLSAKISDLIKKIRLPFTISVKNIKLLCSLIGLRGAEVLEIEGAEVVSIGYGPWDEEDFDDAYESVGFVPQLLDHEACNFSIFIVGESGVDIDCLAEQMHAAETEGMNVRLFSQELWLLYLMTGVDPTTLPAELLVDEIGMSHPVISAFIGGNWNWPRLIETKEPRGGGGEEVEASGVSPLGAFGYTVRASESAEGRRRNLRAFFECSNISQYFDPENHGQAYRAKWGTALSPTRLKAMVHLISWLMRGRGKSPAMKAAGERWRSDLEWMRRNLAPLVKTKFTWPV